VTLIAVATGAVVANLYYAQPVLHLVAHDFHSGSGLASLIITATQVGYAAGLLLIVPLGDLHSRRVLVTRIFAVAAVALMGCALAPDIWVFGLASVAVGAASVAGQVMIPFAADLAQEERRGRVVARIMTGLLLGILLARTVSGSVAQLAGWRAIYWFSAALMVAFALILWRALPAEGPRPHRSYWNLVGTSLRLLVDEPVLRRRAWHGACAFACFSVLWTTIAFLLSGAPYNYSSVVIGLFGLVGAAGILAANMAGRLADADQSSSATLVAGVLLIGAFGLLWLGRSSLAALIAGIVVLDIGTQGMQITNQAIIYALRPDARSRINSAYMVCYFIGGAVGSVTAGVVYGARGWSGVCLLGTGFGLLTCALTAYDFLRRSPRTAHASVSPPNSRKTATPATPASSGSSASSASSGSSGSSTSSASPASSGSPIGLGNGNTPEP
jgi:predicted MFS family arabinose efflux permease